MAARINQNKPWVWTDDNRERLRQFYRRGPTINTMMLEFGITRSAVAQAIYRFCSDLEPAHHWKAHEVRRYIAKCGGESAFVQLLAGLGIDEDMALKIYRVERARCLEHRAEVAALAAMREAPAKRRSFDEAIRAAEKATGKILRFTDHKAALPPSATPLDGRAMKQPPMTLGGVTAY